MTIDVNIIAVVVAAVANMILGMLWYSKLMFGKTWMKESGMTEGEMKKSKEKGMAKEMLAAVLASLVMAYVLAHFISIGEMVQEGSALTVAFWVWLGFMATLLLDGVLWEGKSVKLWFINASYRLVSVLAMAAIISAWV